MSLFQLIFKLPGESSGQGGVIGRYSSLPRTTKRRITTKLKTKNNQNCQKIKLYGSLTSMELKKKHSPRLVGGAKTGSWGGEDSWQGGSWQQVGWVRQGLANQDIPQFHADKL